MEKKHMERLQPAVSDLIMDCRTKGPLCISWHSVIGK